MGMEGTWKQTKAQYAHHPINALTASDLETDIAAAWIASIFGERARKGQPTFGDIPEFPFSPDMWISVRNADPARCGRRTLTAESHGNL